MASILIIDDERPIRSTLRDILEYEKIKITEAEDGIKGLDLIKANDYDAILCDIKMPGMDGMALLELIAEQNPGLPVIIMTAHSDLDSAVNAFQKGAFEYLAKPFDLNEAVALVESACRANSTKKTKRKQGGKKSKHTTKSAKYKTRRHKK